MILSLFAVCYTYKYNGGSATEAELYPKKLLSKKVGSIPAWGHYNVSIYDRQLCFNIGRVMLKYKVYVELLLNICRDRFKYRVYIQTYFLIYSNVKVLLEYMHSNNVEM